MSISILSLLFSSTNWEYAIEISEKSFAILESSISHVDFLKKKKESFIHVYVTQKEKNV